MVVRAVAKLPGARVIKEDEGGERDGRVCLVFREREGEVLEGYGRAMVGVRAFDKGTGLRFELLPLLACTALRVLLYSQSGTSYYEVLEPRNMKHRICSLRLWVRRKRDRKATDRAARPFSNTERDRRSDIYSL